MKLNRILLTIVSAGLLLFGLVAAGTAGGGEPGSVEDPLVTRSYVESRISAVVKQHTDKYMQWQVAELAPGQQLEGKAGAELIVRTGSMAVVDPLGNGIPDVTAGVNVLAGQVAAVNHHLIIPRSDGRGLAARTKAVVMFKGEVAVK